MSTNNTNENQKVNEETKVNQESPENKEPTTETQNVSSENNENKVEANIPSKESVKIMMNEITVENYSENIKKASKFNREGDKEKCLDMLDAMIKKGLNLFEDYDIRLAEPYFRLGDVLLENLESKNDLFGDIQKKKENENENGNEMSSRDQEIQVAWENMEIARVLLEKYLANKSQLEVNDAREKSLLLAEIFRRFGDCESFKENFTKAKEEFLKSIKILEEIEDKETSRRLSSNYYLIGITVNHEAKVGHAKEAKIYIEKAIAIMENVSKKDDMDEVTKKEVSSLLSMMKQKRDDLKEEIETTNPADPDAIKKAISQTKFNTSTSFPKSQLKDVKVNKLGVFGKGKETMSKKLKEPATLITREEISKPIKKVQTETPKETS